MAEPAGAAGIRTYRIPQTPPGQFDIIHANELYPTHWALSRFPGTPLICTVHSQYPCEQPLVHPRVLHYICVRPEVQEKITRIDGVPVEKTSVIYNPIDFGRFRDGGRGTGAGDREKRVLFCGTIDALRKRSILDLIERATTEGFELRLVGIKACTYDGYIDHGLPPSVSWYDQTWHVEEHVRWCDETAGILLGRTTIEGWACGKPGWIYDIDLGGRIKSRALHQPPAEMERFEARHVTDQIEALYRRYAAAAAPAAEGRAG
jgi:Glycosyltransferase Family 4